MQVTFWFTVNVTFHGGIKTKLDDDDDDNDEDDDGLTMMMMTMSYIAQSLRAIVACSVRSVR